MIYPPSQKPPIWSIDPGVIAYNCQKAGMPQPVGAYPFWEGAGTLARDYSGRGNHGTINGGAAWVPGGIDFNGTDGYIGETFHSSDASVENNGDKITVSQRIYPKSLGGAADSYLDCNPIISKGDGSTSVNTYEWSMGIEGGEIYIRTNGGNNGGVGSLSTNESVHAVFVWNGGENTIVYINNIEYIVSHTDLSPNNAAWDVLIGRSFGKYFDGIIDNPIMFNAALSAAQVKFLTYNPYFMYQIPEELYGYVAGAPPIGNPFWYYNMLRRRN